MLRLTAEYQMSYINVVNILLHKYRKFIELFLNVVLVHMNHLIALDVGNSYTYVFLKSIFLSSV